MNFKEVKESPEENQGDLSKKKHQFSGVKFYAGECGDHYCPGHTDFYVICTCGFVGDIHDYSPSKSEDAVIAKHRQAVTEYHLKLSFKR